MSEETRQIAIWTAVALVALAAALGLGVWLGFIGR